MKPEKCIEGKRVTLRPISEEAPLIDYLGWLQDSEVTRYLEARFTDYTVEKLRAYIRAENEKPNAFFFGICLNPDGRLIGTIKLSQVRAEHRHCELGLMIGDKTAWGRGYGAEAIELACRYAFECLGLHKVAAGCYGNNLGSARAFEKAGFSLEGRLAEDRWSAAGWVDKLWLGLINPSENGRRQKRENHS